tara:strand:+ start:1218 stop:1439 length:222 start_codon:yes stop_codon:yes gene_type:complete
MKTLVNEINGRKDFPIFEGTNEKILEWVEMNLDMFDLNEEHSCNAGLFKDEIVISGDEDSKIFEIIKVETIKL